MKYRFFNLNFDKGHKEDTVNELKKKFAEHGIEAEWLNNAEFSVASDDVLPVMNILDEEYTGLFYNSELLVEWYDKPSISEDSSEGYERDCHYTFRVGELVNDHVGDCLHEYVYADMSGHFEEGGVPVAESDDNGYAYLYSYNSEYANKQIKMPDEIISKLIEATKEAADKERASWCGDYE